MFGITKTEMNTILFRTYLFLHVLMFIIYCSEYNAKTAICITEKA